MINTLPRHLQVNFSDPHTHEKIAKGVLELLGHLADQEALCSQVPGEHGLHHRFGVLLLGLNHSYTQGSCNLHTKQAITQAPFVSYPSYAFVWTTPSMLLFLISWPQFCCFIISTQFEPQRSNADLWPSDPIHCSCCLAIWPHSCRIWSWVVSLNLVWHYKLRLSGKWNHVHFFRLNQLPLRDHFLGFAFL